jgi:hypothetical protein
MQISIVNSWRQTVGYKKGHARELAIKRDMQEIKGKGTYHAIIQ